MLSILPGSTRPAYHGTGVLLYIASSSDSPSSKSCGYLVYLVSISHVQSIRHSHRKGHHKVLSYIIVTVFNPRDRDQRGQDLVRHQSPVGYIAKRIWRCFAYHTSLGRTCVSLDSLYVPVPGIDTYAPITYQLPESSIRTFPRRVWRWLSSSTQGYF